VRYGNIPVSLYTGQVNVSIPLYHIKDPDFDIPLVLNYASDGFKPYKRAGWVGLNWSLGGVGVVTREIYGAPDDFTYYTEGNGDPYVGYLHATEQRGYDWDALYNFEINMQNIQNISCILPPFDEEEHNGNYDSEPDLFTFTLPGHSGRFMIDNHGNPICDHRGYTVDLSGIGDQNEDVGTEMQSTIVITAPDGYIYTFGGNINTLEFTIAINRNEHISSFIGINKPIQAWHLTSITAPNGRILTLNYANVSLSTTSPFWFSSRNDPSAGSAGDNPPGGGGNGGGGNSPPIDRIPGDGDQPATGSNSSDSRGTVDPNEYQATKLVFLHSIEIADTGLSLEFQQSIESCYTFFEEDLFYNNLSYQLDNLLVKQGNNTMFSYHLEYENRQHLRFLKQVTQPDGGIYILDYTHPTTYPILNVSTFDQGESIDDYGYYYTSSPSPRSLLNKITYPTGGDTTFEYEPHSYGKKVEIEVTETYEPQLQLENGNASGFRIKKMTHHSKVSGIANTTEVYTYKRPDSGIESGILLKTRPFISSGSTGITPIITRAWTHNYNIEEPHIGYSYVKVASSDSSYVQYRFSDYQLYPDTTGVNFYWCVPSYTLNSSQLVERSIGLAVANATLVASSYDKRGLMIQKSIFNSSGVEQQRTDYAYRGATMTSFIPADGQSLSELSPNYIVAFRGIPGGAMAMCFNLQTHPVIQERITSYFSDATSVVELRSYERNSFDCLTMQKNLTSKGDTLKQLFKYPTDLEAPTNPQNLYTRLVNRNIVDRIVEKEQYLNNTFLSAQKTVPKILANNDVVDDVVYTRKGSTEYEERARYYNYDAYGNPVYLKDIKGISKVLIWSYKGRYLVAEIMGATYNEVQTALGATPESVSSQVIPNMTTLDGLRATLPNALITTYTYSPLVGMTSTTAPNGATTYYDYDGFGRLKSIRDAAEDTLETYHYKYRNLDLPFQPTPPTYEPLQIVLYPADRYRVNIPGTFTAGISGGSGSVSRQWILKRGNTTLNTWQTTGNTLSHTFTQEREDYSMTLIVTDSITLESDTTSCGVVFKEYPLSFAVTDKYVDPWGNSWIEAVVTFENDGHAPGMEVDLTLETGSSTSCRFIIDVGGDKEETYELSSNDNLTVCASFDSELPVKMQFMGAVETNASITITSASELIGNPHELTLDSE
jgi:YD repeat-containing protein